MGICTNNGVVTTPMVTQEAREPGVTLLQCILFKQPLRYDRAYFLLEELDE